MQLQTKIPIHQQEPKIDYNSEVLLVGSCFVENIGKKLEFFKFKNLLNPFGILFHPEAIAGFFKNVKEEKIYSEEDVFFHQERWLSFDAHSVVSKPKKEDLIQLLNEKSKTTKLQLQKATHVIITLGTAWGYELKSTGKTVANCHKVPQREFQKQLQSVESIFSNLKNIVEVISEVNPKTTVIFTISPVRHIKDGFVENQRSKAHLIAAVHRLIEESDFSKTKISYFPSYEIMMDELRDYRFYAEDMIHPSQLAVDYIWNRFSEAWIAPEAKATMKEVETIQRGLQHRPFNEQSEQHQKFLQDLEQKKQQLQSQFPYIRFSE